MAEIKKQFMSRAKAKKLLDKVIPLNQEEQKIVDNMKKKGYRALICPTCGAKYVGKYLVGIVVCGSCLKRANSRR